MYIVQTCTNVPKWGWIDVGVRDNVGTRWGHLAPEKRTQGGTAVRNLSSGHVPKLLRRPLLPICNREYFKREVLMQICDM